MPSWPAATRAWSSMSKTLDWCYFPPDTNRRRPAPMRKLGYDFAIGVGQRLQPIARLPGNGQEHRKPEAPPARAGPWDGAAEWFRARAVEGESKAAGGPLVAAHRMSPRIGE